MALFWSTGKDSAWALEVLRGQGYEVRWLVSTVHETNGRVAVHGVRRELLVAQAEAVDLPLIEVPLPEDCPNTVYSERVGEALERLRAEGAVAVAAGDLFLEDVRTFREIVVREAGLEPLFPLWRVEAAETLLLAHKMLQRGLKAVLVACDPRRIGIDFLGAPFGHDFLAALPRTVDPLGERGEFHTFTTWAPGFRRQIAVVAGALHHGPQQSWIELLPAQPEKAPDLLASRPG